MGPLCVLCPGAQMRESEVSNEVLSIFAMALPLDSHTV